MRNLTDTEACDVLFCLERGMFLIAEREKQMIGKGYGWPINTNACRGPLEQSILGRDSGETMMAAVVKYVEGIEYQAEIFNGIEGGDV